jgi:hypothetical protein
VAATSFKKGFKGKLPEDHYDELIAEMKRNPRHASRMQLNAFFAHVEKYGGIAGRLAGARSPTWLVRGNPYVQARPSEPAARAVA